MAESFFDSSWYRVANLVLRLRSNARVYRQVFRGQVWFVIQDHQTGQFHRLTPAANLFTSMMDGTKTVDQIWQACGEQLGDDQASQGEVIKLLSQLHRANVLHGELPPDVEELARRAVKTRRSKITQRFKNPLGIRLPLLDPERFLTATQGAIAWAFGPVGAILWLSVVIAGGVLAILHWDALSSNVADRVLVGNNLLQMIVAYTLIKGLHELGHAYTVKRWGGEVHEIGLMFLVFMPVPYVDASSSSAFPSKWQRAAVAAAGILMELFIAACAMIVWVNVEPGFVHASAYNVMLIAGVSTLLFNGNPLLRFDGYYVFSDLIEIPNLGKRANDYFFYQLKTRFLKLQHQENPASAPGEAGWMLFYSIASFIYRMSLLLVITWYLLNEIPVAGLLLAAWMIFNSLVMPLYKGIRFLVTNPAMHVHRRRKIAIISGVLAAVLLVLLGTPVPWNTVTEGYVWVPEQSVVRARSEGTIEAILVEPNSQVTAGTPLIRLVDPLQDAEIRVTEAERQQLAYQLQAVQLVDRVQAKMISEQIRRTDATLAHLREQAEKRTISAEAQGQFAIAAPQDMIDRLVRRGDAVAYLVGNEAVVHVLVDQDHIDLVRNRTQRVEVRFSESIDHLIEAQVARETPAAVEDIPHQALSTSGGGKIALDPSDPESQKLLNSMFQLELALEGTPPDKSIGGRAYVRFDHGYAPLGPRLLRQLRQLFMGVIDA